MNKSRKKPVVIEAFKMTEQRLLDKSDWPDWLRTAWLEGSLYLSDKGGFRGQGNRLHIKTLEGPHTVTFNDWIIKGVEGEIYPCKPSIFEATYEAVTYNKILARLKKKYES